MTNKPNISRHLATLNLFRESDGKVYITIAEARGAIAEYRNKEPWGSKPIDYIEGLVYDAATETLKLTSRGFTK